VKGSKGERGGRKRKREISNSCNYKKKALAEAEKGYISKYQFC
jgi:hypothetical protein